MKDEKVGDKVTIWVERLVVDSMTIVRPFTTTDLIPGPSKMVSGH